MAAEQGEAAAERANFEKTKFFADAGFTDPDLLSEMLTDLDQDIADLESRPVTPERTQLIQDIAKTVVKIKKAVGETIEE